MTNETATTRYELEQEFGVHLDRYVETLKRSAVADRRGEITWRQPRFGGRADTLTSMVTSAAYMIREWERDADAKKRLAASLDKIIDTSDDQKIVLEAIQTKSQLLGMIR